MGIVADLITKCHELIDDIQARRMDAALKKIKGESDLAKKAALCEAFLKKFSGNTSTHAEVEDLYAEAIKTGGVEKAKEAYAEQAETELGVAFLTGDDNYNVTFKLKEAAEKSGLTEAEALAIRIYTTSAYKFINPAVANQKDNADKKTDWMDAQQRPDPSKAKDDVEKQELQKKLEEYEAKTKKKLYGEGAMHAGMMMEAFKKLPPKKSKLFRGARMTQQRFDSEYKKGAMITYEAFVSSATDEKVAQGFADGMGNVALAPDATVSVMVEAFIEDARDIAALSVSERESELLVLPGTQLVVDRIEDNPVKNERPKDMDSVPKATAWPRVFMKQVLK